MADSSMSIAQRSREKRYFDHADMDYYLSWIMGREIYDGSDAGECLETAAHIVDGDAQSWGQAWQTLAAQVEAAAQTALERGEREKARRAFLRACTYYRAPLFMMHPQDDAFEPCRQKMQACFQQAALLFDSPLERIVVPFEGHLLAGYLWKRDNSAGRRPALVVFGGIETFAEDCYFMVGSAGFDSDYVVLTVDLPGQGVTPQQGLYFGARMERPVAAVLDAVMTRPDIDPDRLAIFGFSWGGHIVFKAAQHDRRVKAMIANPAMPDVFRAVLAQQSGHDRTDPIARLVFQQIAWRMGLKISLNAGDIARRFGKAYDYLVYGRADPRQIACPTLCLAGEGEAPITLQIARECYERLPHPQKALVIFTREQGGEAHCQVDNLALPNGAIFAWLNHVFA